eukprot:ANDGO_01894.mRNA.1 hypothetical protein
MRTGEDHDQHTHSSNSDRTDTEKTELKCSGNFWYYEKKPSDTSPTGSKKAGDTSFSFAQRFRAGIKGPRSPSPGRAAGEQSDLSLNMVRPHTTSKSSRGTSSSASGGGHGGRGGRGVSPASHLSKPDELTSASASASEKSMLFTDVVDVPLSSIVDVFPRPSTAAADFAHRSKSPEMLGFLEELRVSVASAEQVKRSFHESTSEMRYKLRTVNLEKQKVEEELDVLRQYLNIGGFSTDVGVPDGLNPIPIRRPESAADAATLQMANRPISSSQPARAKLKLDPLYAPDMPARPRSGGKGLAGFSRKGSAKAFIARTLEDRETLNQYRQRQREILNVWTDAQQNVKRAGKSLRAWEIETNRKVALPMLADGNDSDDEGAEKRRLMMRWADVEPGQIANMISEKQQEMRRLKEEEDKMNRILKALDSQGSALDRAMGGSYVPHSQSPSIQRLNKMKDKFGQLLRQVSRYSLQSQPSMANMKQEDGSQISTHRHTTTFSETETESVGEDSEKADGSSKRRQHSRRTSSGSAGTVVIEDAVSSGEDAHAPQDDSLEEAVPSSESSSVKGDKDAKDDRDAKDHKDAKGNKAWKVEKAGSVDQDEGDEENDADEIPHARSATRKPRPSGEESLADVDFSDSDEEMMYNQVDPVNEALRQKIRDLELDVEKAKASHQMQLKMTMEVEDRNRHQSSAFKQVFDSLAGLCVAVQSRLAANEHRNEIAAVRNGLSRLAKTQRAFAHFSEFPHEIVEKLAPAALSKPQSGVHGRTNSAAAASASSSGNMTDPVASIAGLAQELPDMFDGIFAFFEKVSSSGRDRSEELQKEVDSFKEEAAVLRSEVHFEKERNARLFDQVQSLNAELEAHIDDSAQIARVQAPKETRSVGLQVRTLTEDSIRRKHAGEQQQQQQQQLLSSIAAADGSKRDVSPHSASGGGGSGSRSVYRTGSILEEVEDELPDDDFQVDHEYRPPSQQSSRRHSPDATEHKAESGKKTKKKSKSGDAPSSSSGAATSSSLAAAKFTKTKRGKAATKTGPSSTVRDALAAPPEVVEPEGSSSVSKRKDTSPSSKKQGTKDQDGPSNVRAAKASDKRDGRARSGSTLSSQRSPAVLDREPLGMFESGMSASTPTTTSAVAPGSAPTTALASTKSARDQSMTLQVPGSSNGLTGSPDSSRSARSDVEHVNRSGRSPSTTRSPEVQQWNMPSNSTAGAPATGSSSSGSAITPILSRIKPVLGGANRDPSRGGLNTQRTQDSGEGTNRSRPSIKFSEYVGRITYPRHSMTSSIESDLQKALEGEQGRADDHSDSDAESDAGSDRASSVATLPELQQLDMYEDMDEDDRISRAQTYPTHFDWESGIKKPEKRYRSFFSRVHSIIALLSLRKRTVARGVKPLTPPTPHPASLAQADSVSQLSAKQSEQSLQSELDLKEDKKATDIVLSLSSLVVGRLLEVMRERRAEATLSLQLEKLKNSKSGQGRLRALPWVLKNLANVYSTIISSNLSDIRMSDAAFEIFATRFGLRKIAEQNFLDFSVSTESMKHQSLRVKTFVDFLLEKHDSLALKCYLLVLNKLNSVGLGFLQPSVQSHSQLVLLRSRAFEVLSSVVSQWDSSPSETEVVTFLDALPPVDTSKNRMRGRAAMQDMREPVFDFDTFLSGVVAFYEARELALASRKVYVESGDLKSALRDVFESACVGEADSLMSIDAFRRACMILFGSVPLGSDAEFLTVLNARKLRKFAFSDFLSTLPSVVLLASAAPVI